MALSFDDVREHATSVSLCCLVVTFIMSAAFSDTGASIALTTVHVALVFCVMFAVYLVRKSHGATLQFQVVSVVTFSLYGFVLGADYVLFAMVPSSNDTHRILDVLLLFIAVVGYTSAWFEQARDMCSNARVHPSDELFETPCD